MYYCGIDVAKLKHTAAIMNATGETVMPAFDFANSQEGFDMLQTKLAALDAPVTIDDCMRRALTVLDRVFPEYAAHFSNVFLASSRQLLAQAVTADEIADSTLDELATVVRKASRERWGQAKAET